MEIKKNSKKKGRERTHKLFEERRLKEEFFSQLADQIGEHFKQEEIQFFFKFDTHSLKELKTQRKLAMSTKQVISFTNSPTQSRSSFCSGFGTQCQTVDLNIFHTLYKHKMKGQAESKKEGVSREGTSRGMGLQGQRQKVDKNMFEVDCKMKKNYERVRQRLKFSKPEDKWRGTYMTRNSTIDFRSLNSPKSNRFATEAQDEKEGRKDSIPRMLLGELGQCRSKEKEKNKQLGISRVRGEVDEQQGRRLCFKQGVCWKRYRCRY